MTRAELATYLGQWYAAYLAEVGRPATDAPEGIRPVLDATLRALGYTGDLSAVVARDDEGMYAWGEYYLLKWVVAELGTRFNVSVTGSSFALSQLYDHAKDALARAEAVVIARYGALAQAQSSGLIMVDLNMFSTAPEETTW